MSDDGPDYKLEMQKLRVAIMTQQAQLGRYDLEVMECHSRIAQAEKNKRATEKAIAENTKNLELMEKEHL